MYSLTHFQHTWGNAAIGTNVEFFYPWIIRDKLRKIIATEARISTPLRISKGIELAPSIILSPLHKDIMYVLI